MDDNKPKRIHLTGKTNVIKMDTLSGGVHKLLICKTTESNIGYIEFAGIKCKRLLPPDPLPERRIEFIGNSITCGTGMDKSEIDCGKGQWHDQHNAYMSYGPQTARTLNARWVLTSVSGIGMIHSCCGMKVTMPDVFDKTNLRDNVIPWNFSLYQPDVLTICLGQNDGIQDSIAFCSAYVKFIQKARSVYPDADIVCLTSPMADDRLTKAMKNYLTGITTYMQKSGDNKVHAFFFSGSYNNGCDTHPDMAQHAEIAVELTSYIRKLKNW
jgi:lysophospholipase L1-like esterase